MRNVILLLKSLGFHLQYEMKYRIYMRSVKCASVIPDGLVHVLLG